MRVKLVVLLAMVVAPAVVLVTVVASDICKVMSPVACPTEGDEVLPVKRVKFGYGDLYYELPATELLNCPPGGGGGTGGMKLAIHWLVGGRGNSSK